jgi:hypothetical protein
VEIFEDSAVTRVRGGRPFRLTVVGGREITSDRLFLATNAYTPALGFLHRRMFPLSPSRNRRPSLGRELHGKFADEILTDWKRRWPGARAKHAMKAT